LRVQKRKGYSPVRFSPEALRSAEAAFFSLLTDENREKLSSSWDVGFGRETWTYDSPDEFYADFRRGPDHVLIIHNLDSEYIFSFHVVSSTTAYLDVKAATRAEIERVFEPLDRAEKACTVEVKEERRKPVVFIGHGRSSLWRDLKDHLCEQHGYTVEAYEIGARAGHAIGDILEDMLAKSSFACLILTAEDATADGQSRARQNVVHELGLFQGRLGFSRAIVLFEDGVEEFSNIAGIQVLPFSKGRIRETFGDVLATLRREFGPPPQ
jgi:predicted nucleotide-binding protein